MNKKQFLIGAIILIIFTVASTLCLRNKLTYLEYSDITNESGHRSTITIKDSNDVLLQNFVMPFEIVHGLGVKVHTFGRYNNSEWNVAVINPKTKKVYCSKRFNGSEAVDNRYLYLEFDRNMRFAQNEIYQIRISARSVNADTALAYYVLNGTKDNLSLTVGGKSYDGTLCIKIYGGEADIWWCGLLIVLSVIVFQLLVRMYYVREIRKGNWLYDTAVQSILVGISSFLLLFSFSTSRLYTDETDNMLGGLQIANGGVLYRDYVAQHPPFAYYLCSVFALFGAKSVEQFRLSYYLVVSIIWGLLYIRHKHQFGMRMLFLPSIEIIVINSMQLSIPYSGSMVLSDCIQGVSFVALLLEFFKFCREKTICWDRAIIVSACVWVSMGSVFLSAFVLLWIFIAFLVVEFRKWYVEGVSLSGVINRYWKLLVALVIPLLLGTAYFAFKHSLTRAFDQIYLFNREVYVSYYGLGKSVLAVFMISFQKFFDAIVNNFNDLMNAKATPTKFMHLIILISTSSIIISMLRKKHYLLSFVLFTVLCCAGVRGFAHFHSIGAWNIAVMIIVLFYHEVLSGVRKIAAPVLVVVCAYSIGIFVHNVAVNIMADQKSVSGFDHAIVSLTNEGEELLVDSHRFNSMYYMYKKRSIVNRVQYILPWFMEWYEGDTIDDLLEHRPRYVLFNQDTEVWHRKYFAYAFLKTLKQNYTQLSDKPAGGWKYYVWRRNDLEQ